MSDIKLIDEGRRIYIAGNTFPIKDDIKAAGGHFDWDRKQWWIGKGKRAEIQKAIDKAAPKQDKQSDEVFVIGKAKHKGKTYYIRFEGATKYSPYCLRLVSLNGKLDFWVNEATRDQIIKRYKEKKSLSSIRRFVDEVKKEGGFDSKRPGGAEYDGGPKGNKPCYMCGSYWCEGARGGLCDDD